MERSKITLLSTLLLFGLISFGLNHFHVADDSGQAVTLIQKYSYFYDILLTIGINIILAVSLNLVNGYTGQFSLGHAGFMAAGAYASSAVTMLLGPSLIGPDGGTAWQQNLLFLGALAAGGLAAAIAGVLVGLPSL